MKKLSGQHSYTGGGSEPTLSTGFALKMYHVNKDLNNVIEASNDGAHGHNH